jgi:hypothetical protein
VVLNGYHKTAEALVGLGRRFELTNEPYNESDCRSVPELFEIAHTGAQSLLSVEHIDECPRCQSWVASFRALRAIKSMPLRWAFSFESPREPSEPAFSQLLGRFDFIKMQFEVVGDDIDWQPSPTTIRVNVVADSKLGLATLTLLEVPSEIHCITLRVDGQLVTMDAAEPQGTFEFVYEDSSELRACFSESHTDFVRRIFGDTVAISLECGPLSKERIGR